MHRQGAEDLESTATKEVNSIMGLRRTYSGIRREHLRAGDVAVIGTDAYVVVDAGRWHRRGRNLIRGLGIGFLATRVGENIQSGMLLEWHDESLERMAKMIVRVRRLAELPGQKIQSDNLTVLALNRVDRVMDAGVGPAVDDEIQRLLTESLQGRQVAVKDEQARLDAWTLMRALTSLSRQVGRYEEVLRWVADGADDASQPAGYAEMQELVEHFQHKSEEKAQGA